MKPEARESYDLGRRAWQEQLPAASNPFTVRGRPGDLEKYHLWLAGWHAEKAKSAQG